MKNRNPSNRGACFLLMAGLLFVAASCSSSSYVPEAVPGKEAVAELVAQADKLYAERADMARTREGVVLLRRAVSAEASSYDAAWRLARFNYFLGTHTTNKIERGRAYGEGIEAGRRAVKIEEGKPEGHFWLGANLGGQAQTSMFSGLTAVDEIREEMKKVIQIDEGFQSGSAYMALGQVDLEAPKILGGDSKRAVETLEKGLRFGKDNALYRLRLAQAYKAVNRKEDARKELTELISLTPHPDYIPEYNEAVAEARKLLDEMKNSQ